MFKSHGHLEYQSLDPIALVHGVEKQLVQCKICDGVQEEHTSTVLEIEMDFYLIYHLILMETTVHECCW